MRRSRWLLAGLAVVVVAGCPAAKPARTPVGAPPTAGADAAPPPDVPTVPAVPLVVDPAVTTGTLPNGLTYYIRKNGQPAKRADLWLAVNAGAVLEDDDQRGVAHFVEHMAFNGTRKFPGQAIVNWLETTGMKFGPDVNAFTAFDETVYQIQVPTDDPAVFDHGLDVLHEWAQGVAFEPAEVEKERGVVLEERRLGRGAQGRLLDKIFPGALPGSKYGQRVPIGTEEVLTKVGPDVLRRFYRDWYRPDLMAVIVVGDVDPAAVAAQIAAQFGDLTGPVSPRPRPEVAVPDQAKPVTLTIQDPEIPVSLVAVVSKQPHRAVRTEADFRAALVDRLATTMLNARLTELGQHAEAPFMLAAVGTAPLLRPIDLWFQGAVVKDDRVEDALTVMATELARADKFGFTATELARAGKELLQQVDKAATERDTTESKQLIGELSRMFLTGEPMIGAVAEAALAHRLVPDISAAELRAVIRRLASEHNRVVLVAGNAAATLPAEAALAAAVAAGAAKATAPYVDDAASGPLVAAPPTPGTITARRELPEIGASEWTLSNGVTVVLKRTLWKNGEVLIGGTSPGGTSLASDADFVAADSADELAAASGAGTLSAVQLDKALAGSGASATVRFGMLGQYVDGVAEPERVETLLQLIYLRLTAPRRDDAAIAAWRAQQVAARAHQTDDPATVFDAKFDEVATSGHPRTRLLTGDDFAKLDVDQALAFYRARLARFHGASFAIVGNFDPATIEPWVLTYLGGLPDGGAPEAWKDIAIKRPSGPVRFDVHQGIEPKATVRALYHVAAPWSLAAEVEIRALADAVAMRLREQLREGMGGTYGVRVRGALARRPAGLATIEIEFGCAPDRAEALLKAAQAEIAALRKRGPSAVVLQKIKETWKRQRQVDTQTNRYWVDALIDDVYPNHDEPKTIVAVDPLIAGLTTAKLKAAAARYLGKDVVIGVLTPATK
ncbi:MAG: insulinase family protein [Myxococcales bacterium]|nr:insulinase family protein [Myxococcales bacterium]MBK7196245.1 insulinase family protein [Myxococcales bacterium]